MTTRSIVIGLLVAAFLGGFTFFNDLVLNNTFFIGNFLPVSVFGTLMLFLLLINPLLGRTSKRLALSGRELAVIVALALFACFIPGGGILHTFSNKIMWPHKHEVNHPAWHGEPAEIAHDGVGDWKILTDNLKECSEKAPLSPEGKIWHALPKDLQSEILRYRDSGAPPVELQDKILLCLNNILADKTFYDPDAFKQLEKKWYVGIFLERGLDKLTDKEIREFNRGLIDAVFPNSIPARKPGVLECLPPVMLADVSENPVEIPNKFAEGIADDKGRLSFFSIPWGPWIRSFGFWVPLIVTMAIAVTGLGLVVHRQWSSHEHLPYPTVEFIRTMLPKEGETSSKILRNRLFWVGTLGVLGIHMLNYANRWFPEYTVPVRISLDISPLIKLIPIFAENWNEYYLGPYARIYYTAVGFAYFLASDVSLSLGIAPAVHQTVWAILLYYGISMPLKHLMPTADASVYSGAYFGIFLVLIYTGRQYYKSVFKRSIFLKSQDVVENHTVWAARVFLVFIALFILQLVVIGIEWQIALLYTIACLMVYVVVSRLLAEAGVIFIRTWFTPCAILWGFMGAKALGPNQLLMLTFITSFLAADPRETMMPFVISGVQLVDRVKVRIGRTAVWGVVALILAFAVGLPTSLYIQYQRGSVKCGGWWFTDFPAILPFDVNSELRQTLIAQGTYDYSESISGWERFGNMVPRREFVIGFAATFSVVILFSFLRYRFAKWPFHPLLFLMFGTWPALVLGSSFLIGWAIKAAVTKYGGITLYQKLKPLMLGLVAGDVLAAIIVLIIGAIYYWKTGLPPRGYLVTPT